VVGLRLGAVSNVNSDFEMLFYPQISHQFMIDQPPNFNTHHKWICLPHHFWNLFTLYKLSLPTSPTLAQTIQILLGYTISPHFNLMHA